MRKFLCGLVLLTAWAAQPAFSQDAESAKEPLGAGVVLADPMKIANLQLDLLAEQRRTLEVIGDWLRAEQKAFQSNVTLWEKSRSELQAHLDKMFGCAFDLNERKCKPREEITPSQEKELQQ